VTFESSTIIKGEKARTVQKEKPQREISIDELILSSCSRLSQVFYLVGELVDPPLDDGQGGVISF